MTASALAFSAMAVFVKRLAPVVQQFELVFFRSAVNLAWVLALMGARRELFWPKRGKKILVFRGLVGFAGVACMFYSISHLPLPVATMLNWCSPLFVILFSRLVLAERMPAWSGLFIPLAFAGLVLLLNPMDAQSGGLQWTAALIGLGAAVFGGMAYVAVRVATATVGVNMIVLFFVGVSTLASAPWAAADFLRPSSDQWVELICLGSFATLGQLTMTKAYRYAPAGVVSMMNLLNPVFGAAFGIVLFHESLAAFQWMGIALVGVSILGLTTRSTSGRSALIALRG
jgi:drug/metabolite transporter (DMT)-like permease